MRWVSIWLLDDPREMSKSEGFSTKSPFEKGVRVDFEIKDISY
jgi:hypothetical protein